jgi:hypothetical protein
MSIAQIDPVAGQLTFAGVGNVEAQLWQPRGTERPITFRGIVGVTMPTVRSFQIVLDQSWVFVMHTDGVSARFDVGELVRSAEVDPQRLAETILHQWGRTHDDAAVLIARSASAATAPSNAPSATSPPPE